MKLIEFLDYNHSFDQCNEYDSRVDVDNCNILVFFKKNSAQFQLIKSNYSNSFYTDIKNYQFYQINYRDIYLSNSKDSDKSTTLEFYFESSSINNTILNKINITDQIDIVKNNFLAFNNTLVSHIDLLYATSIINIPTRAKTTLPQHYKCKDSSVESNLIFKLTQLTAYSNIIYSSNFHNDDEKVDFIREIEQQMRNNNCSDIDTALANAINLIRSKTRNLNEYISQQFNFTLINNAAIIQIENNYINKLDSEEKKTIVINANSLLREVIENNQNDEFTTTAKLIYSALLVDFFPVPFSSIDVIHQSIVTNSDKIIRKVINGNIPIGSYFRYSYKGMKSNIVTKATMNLEFDFNNALLYIVKSRKILYSLVLNDGTSISLVLY